MHAGTMVARGFCMRAFAVTAVAVAIVLPGAATAQARVGGKAKLDRVERRIIKKINRVRGQFALPRLRVNRALGRSADYHSWDMVRANFFAHTSANGTPFDARVRRFKRAKRVGETIAYTRRGGGARQVVDMWMTSPSHRASLLDRGFRRIGVGRRKGRLGGARVVVFTADLSSAR